MCSKPHGCESQVEIRAFSVFGTTMMVRRLRVFGKLGRDTARTGIFQTIQHHVQYIKLGARSRGKKQVKEGTFRVMVLLFPSNHH